MPDRRRVAAADRAAVSTFKQQREPLPEGIDQDDDHGPLGLGAAQATRRVT
jgi:hypothetical protein